MKNLKIIKIYFTNSLQQNLANILVFIIFLLSKLVRYGLFLAFLYLMTTQLKFIGGYAPMQMLVFYLCFNLVDTAGQMLFREVYRFRPLIVSGGFDMVLAKPMSPLIRVLLGGPDFIDSGIFIILLTIIISLIFSLQLSIQMIFGFCILIINSFFISAAFHIMVLSLGVMTTSVDNIVMMYRDLTGLVRVPVDFYTQPLRGIITFIIPLGIMFTFPAKALLGLLNTQTVIISFVCGVMALFLSVKFWNYSLKHYQSAGS